MEKHYLKSEFPPKNRVNPPTTVSFCVCLCLLVTLYGRYRGRVVWQWCLPAPALLNRWHIPQSPWTGRPLRKTIWTQTNWAKCSLTHQTLYQMLSFSHWILQNHLFNLCYQNTRHHLCPDDNWCLQRGNMQSPMGIGCVLVECSLMIFF